MKLEEVLQAIKVFSQEHLQGDALAYLLEKRKISRQVIDEFEIGYFPFGEEARFTQVEERWLTYYKLAFKAGRDLRILLEGRIVFPIYDLSGKLVSIQARRFHEDASKYLFNERKYWHNSFNKSRILHGLIKAIPEIRRTGQILITEGQFDLVRAHESGLTNCICTSGTVLTNFHIGLLARYAKELLIVFDNDMGGQRGLEKLGKKHYPGTQLRFITLPSSDGQKQDLDSYLLSQGIGSFRQLLVPTKQTDSLLTCLSTL